VGEELFILYNGKRDANPFYKDVKEIFSIAYLEMVIWYLRASTLNIYLTSTKHVLSKPHLP